jgi:transposase-like protein
MDVPFCPNSRCSAHNPGTNTHFRFKKKNGYHKTKVIGLVQRYRCAHCGKTFSDRTFAADYWVRKTLDYGEILRATCEGESPSAVARNLHCAWNAVQNRIGRLSRNLLAMHHEVEETLPLTENLVADGFESFDKSQFFPSHVSLLVGQKSQHCYAFSHASQARKGAMTKEQKIKKEQISRLWASPRGGVKASFTKVLRVIPSKWEESRLPRLELITDKHPAYPGAILSVAALKNAVENQRMHHLRFSSKLQRDIRNPLFSVNYLDRELRKDVAAYARESTCFNRNVANGMNRLVLYLVRHNYWKPHRMRPKNVEENRLHAEVAGYELSVIEKAKARVFWDRAFLTKTDYHQWEKDIWLRNYKTPLKTGPEYLPTHAKT